MSDTYYHYTNPFCQPKTPKELYSSSSLFYVFFIFITMVLLFSIFFTQSFDSFETPHIYHLQDDKLYGLKNNQEPSEYKNFVAPKNGVLKLTRGIFTQTHHSIKEDSVIMLSRKSVDGKPGLQLIVKEIVPNKKFVVHSVNSDGDIETEDCGEIYFIATNF